MVPEACSGKEPAGSKAATREAFTFKWGGPGGGRARRARALSSLGAQPRPYVAPCSCLCITGPGRGRAQETRRGLPRLFPAFLCPKPRRWA